MGELGEAAAPALVCRYCAGPMPPAKRRGVVKEFCSDKHRVAHRQQLQQAALADARLAITEAQDDLERHVARLTGALALLDRLTVRPRKKVADPKISA